MEYLILFQMNKNNFIYLKNIYYIYQNTFLFYLYLKEFSYFYLNNYLILIYYIFKINIL